MVVIVHGDTPHNPTQTQTTGFELAFVTLDALFVQSKLEIQFDVNSTHMVFYVRPLVRPVLLTSTVKSKSTS